MNEWLTRRPWPPVLAGLRGCADDLLIRADGLQVHSLAPIHVRREIPETRQFRVHQMTARSVSVARVPNRPLPAATRADIVRRLHAVLGELPVDRVDCDTIAPKKSGKYRWVISEAT